MALPAVARLPVRRVVARRDRRRGGAHSRPDPDLAVLLTSARSSGEPLRGPALDQVTDPVLALLPAERRPVLELARQGYLGEAVDDWTDLAEPARQTAECLAGRTRRP